MHMIDIEGYTLRFDVFYDRLTDTWIEINGDTARIGFDPLGLEINGTLAQLAVAPVGTVIRRGESAGTLEAEKFVGPIASPLSGEVTAINHDALDNVSSLHRRPFEAWLMEVRFANEAEFKEFVTTDEIAPVFLERLEEYRKRGVLAK